MHLSLFSLKQCIMKLLDSVFVISGIITKTSSNNCLLQNCAQEIELENSFCDNQTETVEKHTKFVIKATQQQMAKIPERLATFCTLLGFYWFAIHCSQASIET